MLSALTTGSTSITIRYNATNEFPQCSETYVISSPTTLTQGNKNFPYRSTTSKPEIPEQNEIQGSQAESVRGIQSAPHSMTIEQRLHRLEKLLSESHNKVYHNFAGLLNSSLQRYMKRLRRPSSGGPDIQGDIWTTSMDCSYSDYKDFGHFIEGQRNIDVTFGESSSATATGDNTPGFHNTHTITFSTFKGLTVLFNISTSMYEKIMTVKRVDRKGKLLAFKAMGTLLQSTNIAHPRVFCLGGDASRWSDYCKFFQREHGHTTQGGVYTAPFVRIRSARALETTLEQFDNPSSPQLQFKWVPTTTQTICSVGIPDTMIMGKLLLILPYSTFNSMTMATKVDDCIKQPHGGEDSDSSSTSW